MKIKYVCFVICLLILEINCAAQTAAPPKEEYKLLPSAHQISIAGGQRDSVKISVIRSKSFRTGKASMVVNSPNVTGLTITIKSNVAYPDEFVLHMLASIEVPVGEYNVIATCTLRNKTKGIIIKLIIK